MRQKDSDTEVQKKGDNIVPKNPNTNPRAQVKAKCIQTMF